MNDKYLFSALAIVVLIILLIYSYFYIDLFMLFVVVLIFLFIFGTLFLMRLNSNDDIPKEKIYNIKSGDCVFVCYDSVKGKLVKFFTGSCWTHCGIVIKLSNKEIDEISGNKKKVYSSNKLYVLEISNYGKERAGVVLQPWNDWLDKNSNRIIGVRTCKQQFPEDKIKNHIKNTSNGSTDFFVVNWLKTMIKRKRNDNVLKNKRKYYCSEYMAYTFQETGILEKTYMPDGYNPSELFFGDQISDYYGKQYIYERSSKGENEIKL